MQHVLLAKHTKKEDITLFLSIALYIQTHKSVGLLLFTCHEVVRHIFVLPSCWALFSCSSHCLFTLTSFLCKQKKTVVEIYSDGCNSLDSFLVCVRAWGRTVFFNKAQKQKETEQPQAILRWENYANGVARRSGIGRWDASPLLYHNSN